MLGNPSVINSTAIADVGVMRKSRFLAHYRWLLGCPVSPRLLPNVLSVPGRPRQVVVVGPGGSPALALASWLVSSVTVHSMALRHPDSFGLDQAPALSTTERMNLWVSGGRDVHSI